MADKVKRNKQLKIVAGFADGDDRTITIDNPKDNLKKSNITGALKTKAGEVLAGDKTGAKFTAWRDARIVESTVTTLDLASA